MPNSTDIAATDPARGAQGWAAGPEPEVALLGWPEEMPLIALYSGEGDRVRARWSMFAHPSEVLVIDGDTPSALGAIQARIDGSPTHGEGHWAGPLGTGWVVCVGYEVGAEIEPAVGSRGVGNARARAVLARIDGGWIHDRDGAVWARFGEGSPSLPGLVGGLEGPERVVGFRVGPLASATGRDRFVAMVERAKAYIRDGDVYQVNLSHPLRASFEGSPRALFAAMAGAARPWHGAYLEWNDARTGARRAIASVSPELFLEYDPATRVVRTRPMKGTLAATSAEDARTLARSEKDRAELNMIIDLMRNDLGKSCVLGSIRVEEARTIEMHTDARGAGLLQATGCVSGVLRPDRTPLDLVRNAFPPGSVTGAPKVRAMQIIRELETEPRDFYCGSIGFIGDDGRLMLNVAIRTATIAAGTIEYPVGAGIVADSDPESEWRETMAKAWPIIRVSESSVSHGSHSHAANPEKATP